MIQKPDFVLLDEPESGVDLENISLIGNAIAKLVDKDVHIVNRKKSGLVITHTGHILRLPGCRLRARHVRWRLQVSWKSTGDTQGDQNIGLQGVPCMPEDIEQMEDLSSIEKERLAQTGLEVI